jgi:hypothetical protein
MLAESHSTARSGIPPAPKVPGPGRAQYSGAAEAAAAGPAGSAALPLPVATAAAARALAWRAACDVDAGWPVPWAHAGDERKPATRLSTWTERRE